MSKLILVTGGARSGKSTFAEDYVKRYGPDILYVATSIACDEEMKMRIKKHRDSRPEWWETIEAYKDLDIYLQNSNAKKDAVILDCITIMITNLLMEKITDWDTMTDVQIEEAESSVRLEIDKLLNVIKTMQIPFIVVTNEVGMGIVPEYPSARVFRDVSGRVNQILARAADEVYLCVSGIPMKVK